MNQSREKIQNLLMMVIDFICLCISYVLAGYIWLGVIKGAAAEALRQDLYGDMNAIIISYVVTALFY